jgi:hypothetical protein
MLKNDHVVPFSVDLKKRISDVIKMDFHPANLKLDWKLIVGSKKVFMPYLCLFGWVYVFYVEHVDRVVYMKHFPL